MNVASRDEHFHQAIFAFDDAALSAWITQRTDATESPDLALDVARAWLAVMQGAPASVAGGVGELFARAASSRVPSRVVEVTALRAMLALAAGQLSEALAFARRASLMARTEALPGAELLANVVLSRLRRHSGKSYLAVRILESLARSEAAREAPGWLAWERLLSGGHAGGEPSADAGTPSALALRAGHEVLRAARAGDRDAFEREAAALERATRGFIDMQREARALCSLLDPARDADEPLGGFKRGQHDELWHGLASARVLHDDSEADIGVLAVARPGERGMRLLRDGLGLFGACRMFFEEGTRAYGRTDTGLAVLALAGPDGTTEEEFFQRVYGFAYSQGKHRGVLDVLLHRIRQRIGTSGALIRAGGGLRLELSGAIAVADPRCSPPAAARVLSALSRQPAATAEAIAGRLGITQRAAQMALKELVSDGACEVRRSGRQVHYQLLDSAFSEPTGNDVFG
ncbi:MAG TPA: winged helix-turn-helix domain-containing protein [Polyangiaceae bacterium]|nr:winged helix-turn-helix domain-containing protein [Polyangiaceae bacterium]